MKLFGVVFVVFLAVGPLSAQYWSVGGFGNVAFPGLGHAPAGGNPWGNVVSPALPGGAAAAGANRYGSMVQGFRSYNGTGSGHRRGGASGIYAYPVYIGGNGYAYAQPDQPQSNAGGADAPAQPTVVINQYFGQAPADQGPSSSAAESNFHYYQAPSNNDADTTPSEQSYYLIAFKDHTIYSAVAYYTEGETLHYFTSGNVHNQVSLALVDRQLTEQLNHQRNVDVRLPQ
ncbi:MAG: hypothetical protein ABSF64_14170 [Bryobacteraceae bacterium]|jgi:hypothetical protein